MLKYMKPIEPNTVPRVLMLGNGIHRSFHDESWDALLKGMMDDRFTDDEWKQLSSEVPYPLLAVIAAGDNLNIKMMEKGMIMCQQTPAEGEKAILSIIPKLGFDAVLTSNYTYEIEKTAIDGFSCFPRRRCKYRHYTCQNKPKS